MAEERQTNYTIGESFTLPSGGKIYNVEVNPHVELRSMTARDEMKRLNPSATPLKTLADIIEGCMIEKPKVHVYDMHLGDYEFLLHKLRQVTYGGSYKMELRCPHCGEVFDTEANLEELEINTYDEEKFNALRTFELPKCKRTVSINYLTPHLMETVEALAKEKKRRFKDSTLDFDTLEKMKACIDTIDGEVKSELEKEKFVTDLAALDMKKLLKNIELISEVVGVNTELTVTCDKCGGEVLTFFRFGPEFFGPTNI